ncbi:MAG: hypothetical protein WDA27_05370 [Actinomycetota bacterium]
MTQRRILLVSRAAVAGAAVFSLVAFPGGAGAEGADPAPKAAAISKQAWYTAKTSNAFPAVIFHEFPPGLMCLVGPEACNDQANAVTQPVEDAMVGISIPGGPVQPVAPATIPVGLLGGKLRYATVMKIDTEPLPENFAIDRFDLVLHEDGAAYAMESPAFRSLVRTLIGQYVDEPSYEPFQAFFESIVAQKTALASVEPTGVEACAVTGSWTEGDNQDAAGLPERECAFGSNGVKAADGSWTFDLSVMARAWADGTIPNQGVYLGPITAQNLEYGDPDYSTNFLLSFGSKDAAEATHPALRVSYVELPAEIEPDPTPSFEPVPIGDPVPSYDFPTTSVPTTVSPPVRGGPIALGPTLPVGKPFIPARMWLAFPLGLVAAALFSRGLGSEAEPAFARAGGALTRLTGGDS